MSSNHQKKVAVILSGCGVYDGAEIHESVLTLLSIEQQGAAYKCFAPDINQHHVINHLTGEESQEQRNVLVEAARIARGDIEPLAALKVADFDALVVPGGFGAAKNLSDFAFKGAELRVQVDMMVAVKAFSEAGKPIGLICIAPAMAGRIFAEGVRATIGNDAATAEAMEQTGVTHQPCAVDEIVIDETHKLVTTPAYMLAQNISEAAAGIGKLVTKVLSMTS
ncbi:isoprenoid biosynthesis glyoxalase ElbB [Endozoicomonas sp. GU-1]|uniref:isoprenoid biosynthesis glyoxalase ElbB n=1 Tax=Endozoicomonas sp. GU-1 TaxID=3009078 RepID=UPI0022B30374|nr:isoprenoid biosynthesis glyoxalase ElbB [Endozoicomonas sp. GU-1]WBA82102.1 isoprenoid biosynthesis glyoxalase ElbB [Endozoicomonas sp. GU-1]WBA85046.1 isoprenoid biosynthesis glyoxalase ElbB [Endozoicomonas sp. GU-1]